MNSFGRHGDVLNISEFSDSLIDELKKRGNFAFTQKSYLEAETLYTKAIQLLQTQDNQIQLKNNLHIYYGNRSASLLNMGKFQEALEDANNAIKIDSLWVKGYFRKAQALEKLKQYKTALDSINSMKQLIDKDLQEFKKNEPFFTKIEQLAEKFGDIKEEEKENTNRVEVIKKTVVKDSSSSRNMSKNVVIEGGNEDLKKFRGYKKLPDGRVTTFFNNELTDEAKALIGDITPKKVDSEEFVQIKNVEGGSAWNQGNTFEEKDMTAWARDRLNELLIEKTIEYKITGTNKRVVISKLSDLSGDAAIAVVRGAKRYIFDFKYTLECDLRENEKVLTSGKLTFLDMSSDCDGDYDTEISVPSRHSSSDGKLLYEIISSSSKGLQPIVAKQLKIFVENYHKF